MLPSFDEIMKASASQVVDWARCYIDPETRVNNIFLSRTLLIEKFCPLDIPACLVCGCPGFLLPRNRRTETGIALHCSHHTRAEKLRATNIELYGSDYTERSYTPKVKSARDKTMVKRYGTVHALMNKECLERREKTVISRYGVKCSFQSPIVQKKISKSLRLRYGVSNPMHSLDLLMKQRASRSCKKKYRTKDGQLLLLQGYEPQVAVYLENTGWSLSSTPETVSYTFDDRPRKYFPDFCVQKNGKRLVLEVKSTYWLGGHQQAAEKNTAKFAAASQKFGTDFRIVVLHKNDLVFIKNPEKLSPDQMVRLVTGSAKHPYIRRISYAL